MTHTYNSKRVIITVGNHIVTGTAEDSFVTIEQPEDGVTAKTGCDGDVVRSVTPSNMHNIRIVLLWGSKSGKYLMNMYKKDREDGTGMFPIEIKDLCGGMLFSAKEAWVTKMAPYTGGKEAQNREWTLAAADGTFEEE